jgi:hypothetical protein
MIIETKEHEKKTLPVKLPKRILSKLNLKVNKLHPRDAVRYAIKHFNNKEIVVCEIGFGEGKHTINSILKYLNVKTLYAIDNFSYYFDDSNKRELNIREIALNTIKKYPKIKLIDEDSKTGINKLPLCDMIYIDGSHECIDVGDDLVLSYKKLKPEGLLCGHDIGNPDVFKAVAEFSSRYNLKVLVSGDDWIIIDSLEGIQK